MVVRRQGNSTIKPQVHRQQTHMSAEPKIKTYLTNRHNTSVAHMVFEYKKHSASFGEVERPTDIGRGAGDLYDLA